MAGVNGIASARHMVDVSVEQIALRQGGKISVKTIIRLPIECYEEFELAVQRCGLTGRLIKECSQGKPVVMTWEGSQ